MASAVISVIINVVDLIQTINTIRDLIAGNAATAITVVDLERVVRGQNAQFFTTIAFADIQTIRDQFYRNWLPSVVNFSTRRRRDITPDDITPSSGTLHIIFQSLIQARTQLAELLNRLREVYRTYSSVLHVDELMRGVFAFFHGFGLLLHMHAVYAELRRIQIGAESLNDRRLLTDTRSVLQYLVDGDAALSVLLRDWTLQNMRLGAITDVRESPGGNLIPGSWYFQDSYSPLASTTPDISLSVAGRMTASLESQARSLRATRVRNVTDRLRAVVANPADNVWRCFARLNDRMRERERVQGGTRAIVRPSQVRRLRPLPIRPRAMMFGALDEGVPLGWEELDTVPESAEEFIALSERLLTEAVAPSGDEVPSDPDPFEVPLCDMGAGLEDPVVAIEDTEQVDEPGFQIGGNVLNVLVGAH
ncbi:hypothetical protein BV25DRAFT_893284 [Artomyces pyxidatus]|uniref:Uncharacterized protein n=1 Tax=Artomyces pyxidatus TaxID=48021 RepID=A0ACB8THN5_9AGAM|nr:hypothetical protein BV25DRAFT_893284 [Artomyces pyxidatus]